MSIEAVSFTGHELLAVAIDLAGRNGEPAPGGVEEAVAYIGGRLGVDTAGDCALGACTQALCVHLNATFEQVRDQIQANEGLNRAVQLTLQTASAVEEVRSLQERDLAGHRACLESEVQDDMREHENQKRAIELAVLSAYAEALERQAPRKSLLRR